LAGIAVAGVSLCYDDDISTEYRINEMAAIVRSDYYSKEEIAAWREVTSVHFKAIEDRLDRLAVTLASDNLTISAKAVALSETLNQLLTNIDHKAQAANDALERMLEAHMTNSAVLANIRHESAQAALIKVDSQLELSRRTALAAVEAVSDKATALSISTAAAIKSTEDKSTTHVISVDEKLTSKIVALQAMVELRSSMNDIAIGKAEQATTLRFDSVNEFRQTLTDQAGSFVTHSALDSKMIQLSTSIDNMEHQLRTSVESSLNSRNEITNRVASLEGKLYVGGAGIVIVITVLQLVLNFFHH
jgi:hypothetical protein